MSEHLCRAMKCKRNVHPRYLMCPQHWRMVPRALQQAVWATYVRGQEVTKTPTREYLRAAHRAILAVADAEKIPVPPALRAHWAGEEVSNAPA
jgi:hypothetical protein